MRDVLIRKEAAQSPRAYGDLVTNRPWRINGILTGSGGSQHLVEIGFGSLEEATAFAESELGLSGRWADPDGDGNYCIVG